MMGDGYSIAIIILSIFTSPITWVGLLIFWLAKRKKKNSLVPGASKNPHGLNLSKEGTLGQLFFLLSFFFFGITVEALNRDFGGWMPWHFIVLVTSSFGLIAAYYFKAFSNLPLALFGLALWWLGLNTEWVDEAKIQGSVIWAGIFFIALIYYCLGFIHATYDKLKPLAPAYRLLGLVPVTLMLMFWSSKSGLESFTDVHRSEILLSSPSVTLAYLSLVVVLAVVLFVAGTKKAMHSYEITGVIILAMLMGIFSLLPAQDLFLKNIGSYYYSHTLSATGTIWALIFNITIFAHLLGILYVGFYRREEWLINFGTIFMFILIFIKYFDWFFSFMDKSLFFIIAGFLLFGVGWGMEKGRRYMISNLEQGGLS